MKVSIRLLTLVLCSLSLSAVASAQNTTQNDPDAARQILEMVNEWRVQEGLWPLKINSTLNTIAIAQASYILPQLSNNLADDAYHKDAQGRTARQRASANNWPNYGHPEQIEAGENAAVGTFQLALDFWQESDVHRRAALSNVYREVGVAALPRARGGHLFMMTFGARPGVFTGLLSPDGNSLFLSGENSRYAKIKSADLQIRVFNALGQPITATMDWQTSVALTPDYGDKLYVLFSSGDFQSVVEVDASRDVAVLTGSASVVSAQPTSVAAFPANTPQPSGIQPMVLASGSIMTPVPALAQPTFEPTVILPTAQAGSAELLLIVTTNAVVLFNQSSSPVNLTGLVIGNDIGSATVERWNTVAPFPMNAFPSKNCLKVQRINTFDPNPAGCKLVRSLITLNPERVFWTQGTFTVRRDTVTLATCTLAIGQCPVNLS
jgi:uncharacterized protein YkwD